jgi:hypothetical protein
VVAVEDPAARLRNARLTLPGAVPPSLPSPIEEEGYKRRPDRASAPPQHRRRPGRFSCTNRGSGGALARFLDACFVSLVYVT